MWNPFSNVPRLFGALGGGAVGKVLKKASAADGDFVWSDDISGGSVWGSITGTLSNQTDLQTALDDKADSSHNHDADYAPIVHTHTASEISDSTAVGRSVLTATDAAAARLAIDAAQEGVGGGAVAWGDITGTLADQTDLQGELDAKADLASPTFTGTVGGITKSMVGLGNVDNTTDAAKPISTATQTALNAKQDTLVSATNIKTINSVTILGSGNLAVSGGDVVYTATPADTAINSVTDITVVTRDVTGVVAGDQLIVDGWFTLLNNSAATRVYVITLDFDGLFDIEFTTGAMATSATLMHPFQIYGVCDVRSTSLAYGMTAIEGQLPAGIASGTDTTMAATHLSGKGWGTSGSNATGTHTVTLRIRSANAAATQTCRLHSFVIRKVTPT